MQLFTSYTTSVEADYVYTHSFFMDSAEITLNVKRKGITRNVKLNFGALSDERRQRLSSDLEAAMPEKGMKLKSCEANENSGVTVEIETESSDSDDSELYKSVFGVSNKLAVSRSSKAPLAASRITNVDDRFDLSRFASGNIPSVTYTIKGVGKELKFNKDSDKKKDKDEGEDKEASDTITREGKNYVRTYTDLDAGTRLENNVTGTTSNFFAILLWIVTAALIAFAAYRIFLFVKEAAANRPAKPAPAAGAAQPPYGVAMPQGSNPFAAAPQTQPAVEPVNTSSEAQPAAEPGNTASAGAAQMKPESAVRFCANCGNKLDADAKFCDSCGTPVE
ncbi:MAG: zinc-ribbon domain-containing protein [Lachnospiraceae bacterium]|nr:zinc-ribbon domain-containing protein [Lachnospiraceae bacterium]